MEKIDSRYEVLETLGQGGMGVVYKVRDRVEGRVAALKMLTVEVSESQAVLRFKREFRSLVRLRHPNLAEVFDFGTTADGNHYFTMEYIDGSDLLELSKGLATEALYPLIVQVLRALEYIHSRGLVHYDVKPTNILVKRPTADGEEPVAKLMDFGLAREATPLPATHIRGTVSYVAPEVTKGVDRRADLYSLGVMLYQITTKRLPFVGQTDISILRQHIQKTPLPPRQINKDIPEGLETIILRLLSKEPADRYSSANEVIRAINKFTGKNFPLQTREIRESYILSGRFVGRDEELKFLQYLFQKAKKGRGSLVLIGGESGVGKTRLVQEFSFHIRPFGVLVFSGTCHEQGGSPHQPFIEILRQLIRWIESRDVEVVKRYGAELLKLVPELAGREYLREIKPSVELEPKKESIRLMGSVTRFICEVKEVAGMPLVLIFEDLHWADEATIQMLGYLGRNSSSRGLLTCGAYREEEVDEGHPLRKKIEELRGKVYFDEINLKRLGQEEVSTLAASMLGMESLEKDLVKPLYDETAGNPFFVEEVVRSLVEEGMLSFEPQTSEIEGLRRIRIPKSVDQVIERRLGRLSEDSLRLLSLASVIGRGFDLCVLRALSGEGEEELTEELGKLERLQLLGKEQRDGSYHYDFGHVRLREILYSRIQEDERRRLHQKVGEVLESQYSESDEEHVGEFAYHFMNGADPEKAIGYGIKAGDGYKKIYANEKAISMYERVLRLLGDEGDSSKRMKVLENLAEVQELLGQYDKAMDNYNRALAMCSAIPDGEGMARMHRRIGSIFQKKGEYDRALECLDAGVKALSGKKSAQMAKIYDLIAIIRIREGKYDSAIDFALRALRILEELKDSKEAASVYNVLGFARFSQADYSQAIECYEKGLEISEKAGDMLRKAMILDNLGIAYRTKGDFSRAVEYHEESLRIKEKIGDTLGIAASLGNLGIAHKIRRDYSQAIDCYQRNLDITEAVGDQLGIASSLNNLGNVYRDRGDYSRAIEHHEKSLEIKQKVGDPRGIARTLINLGHTYRIVGKLKKAKKLFQQAQKLASELGSKLLEGRVYELLGRLARAEKQWEKADEYLNNALTISTELNDRSRICSVMLGLSDLCWEKGHSVEALESCDKALRIAQELNSKGLLAAALLTKGKMEIDRGTEGTENAIVNLEEALGLTQDMPETLWQVHWNLGRAYLEHDRLGDALGCYRNSVDILKAICMGIKKKDLQRSYISDRERLEVIRGIEDLERKVDQHMRRSENAHH